MCSDAIIIIIIIIMVIYVIRYIGEVLRNTPLGVKQTKLSMCEE